MLKIDYFNPVVEDYHPPISEEEIERQYHLCDYLLYVVAAGSVAGSAGRMYTIAELIDSSDKFPDKTIFCVIYEYNWWAFGEEHLRILKSIRQLAERKGAKTFDTLEDVAGFLNLGVKDDGTCPMQP